MTSRTFIPPPLGHGRRRFPRITFRLHLPATRTRYTCFVEPNSESLRLPWKPRENLLRCCTAWLYAIYHSGTTRRQHGIVSCSPSQTSSSCAAEDTAPPGTCSAPSAVTSTTSARPLIPLASLARWSRSCDANTLVKKALLREQPTCRRSPVLARWSVLARSSGATRSIPARGAAESLPFQLASAGDAEVDSARHRFLNRPDGREVLLVLMERVQPPTCTTRCSWYRGSVYGRPLWSVLQSNVTPAP